MSRLVLGGVGLAGLGYVDLLGEIVASALARHGLSAPTQYAVAV